MNPSTQVPSVAIVLPPREGFGPGRTGAVGLIARRLAAPPPPAAPPPNLPSSPTSPPFRTIVVGGVQAGPLFADVPFLAARPVAWFPANPNRRYAAGVARLLRRAAPALIEVHNRVEIALHLAGRLPHTPVSLFLHNDPQGMGGLKSPRERARVLRRLARVVTVSDFVRDRFLEGVTIPPGRTGPFVLANAIDLTGLPPAASDAAREPAILFVGRLVPEKAPDVFVAACARALPALSGWRAEMIGADRFEAGGADTPFIRTLRAEAAAAGVAMTGYRTHGDVLAALSHAAIAVMPSRWREPFGLTALEAMACGAALVCSPRGGLREVGGDAVVYVDPDDPAAVTAAIVGLARDPVRRAALAQAGRARATLFDLPHAVARLDALRREIVGGHPAGGRV